VSKTVVSSARHMPLHPVSPPLVYKGPEIFQIQQVLVFLANPYPRTNNSRCVADPSQYTVRATRWWVMRCRPLYFGLSQVHCQPVFGVKPGPVVLAGILIFQIQQVLVFLANPYPRTNNSRCVADPSQYTVRYRPGLPIFPHCREKSEG